MKQIIALSFLFILITTIQLSAAHSPFTIEDYIPEKFTDKIWTIGGDFNLSSRYSENPDDFEYNGNLIIDKNEYTSYKMGINSTYSYIYQTIPEFFDYKISVSTDYNSINSESTDYNEFVYSNYSERFRWNNQERKYYNLRISPSGSYGKYFLDDFFGQFDINSRILIRNSIKNNNYTNEKDSRDFIDSLVIRYENNATEGDSKDYNYDIKARISTGYGRTYSGKYTAITLYILDELRKKQMLESEPDSATIFELTDILYQYTNKHAVDQRIHYINMIDAFVSLLVKKNLVVSENRYTPLLVDDIYKYYPANNRAFGFKVTIGFDLRYRYSTDKLTNEVRENGYAVSTNNMLNNQFDTLYRYLNFSDYYRNNEQEILQKGIITSITYNKPLSPGWQLNSNLSGSYYFDSYQIRQKYEKNIENNITYEDLTRNTIDIQKNYKIEASVHIMYILSTRTTWNSSIRYYYWHYQEKENMSTNNREEWLANITSSLEYRISIPTTLRLNANYNHSYNGSSFSLSASINHYIY